MPGAFRSIGAVGGPSVSGVTPGLPAGIQTGDILLLAARSINGQAVTIANANGGTWTECANSPIDNAASGIRGTLFWSRYNGTQGAPTTNDAGTINLAVILAYQDCLGAGDPFDVLNSNFQTATTAASIPGGDSTVDDVLAVAISVCDRDANTTDANASAWANASLESITERFDQTFASGQGGGFAIADGVKATAGTISATTWTQAAAEGLVNFLVTLKPASSVVSGGATAEVEADGEGAGSRISAGSSSAEVEADGEGAGAKAGRGGATASVEVAATGAGEPLDNSKEGGATAEVEASSTGAGRKASSGSSTAAVEASSTGAGRKAARSSSSTAGVEVAATGAGVKIDGIAGGSTAAVEVAAAGAGRKASRSSSTATVEASSTGTGRKASSSSSATGGVEVEATGGGVLVGVPDAVGGSVASVQVASAGAGLKTSEAVIIAWPLWGPIPAGGMAAHGSTARVYVHWPRPGTRYIIAAAFADPAA